MNEGYFVATLSTLPARFDKIIEKTKVLIDAKVGLRAEKMIRGGFISSVFRDDPTGLLNLKREMSRAVTSQMSMKEFIGVIKENVRGTPEKLGSLQRQFQRFAYDTYQQYDRAYNKKLAEEFDLKYFVYEGGLIKDSRDFCAAHDGKVWSIEESESWKDWTPDKGEYPPNYEIKAKDTSVVPSYIDFAGYDPLVDCGGYNCRHVLGFIPDDLAEKLRPDLK